MRKNISILGSTGSIGKQTLEVVANYPNKFRVIGLSARDNINLLAEQVKKFQPKLVSVDSEATAEILQKKLGRTQTVVYSNEDGLIKIATHKEVDTVVIAIPGSVGIIPTFEAIEQKKNIALASKEVLVAAGDLVMREVKKKKIELIPIDSEHSGVLQCIRGEEKEKIKRIILTASGGPFIDTPKDKLDKVTVKEALAHPNWNMGTKITIDSATLMNKGFEVIEAHHLFDIDYSKIDVVVHPQSMIHAMVEFVDGTVMAQLGAPDMRIPIQFAMLDQERLPNRFGIIDLVKMGALNFIEPDLSKFPCLAYAYAAGKKGGTLPAVLNAANNEAVSLFLAGKIKFTDIAKLTRQALEKHFNSKEPSLEEIIAADAWAKKEIQTSLP